MSYAHQRQEAREFAERIKALGFKVYMAEKGTYGFITDDSMSRVMGFEFDGLRSSLGGNYGPATQESGTGWQLSKNPEQIKTAEDVKAALYETPPPFAGKGWRYFTTVEQHLAVYGSSSKYVEI